MLSAYSTKAGQVSSPTYQDARIGRATASWNFRPRTGINVGTRCRACAATADGQTVHRNLERARNDDALPSWQWPIPPTAPAARQPGYPARAPHRVLAYVPLGALARGLQRPA